MSSLLPKKTELSPLPSSSPSINTPPSILPGSIKSAHVPLESKSPGGEVSSAFMALRHCMIQRKKPATVVLTILQALLEGAPLSKSTYKDITQKHARLVYSFIDNTVAGNLDNAFINISKNQEAIVQFLNHIEKKGFITGDEKGKVLGESNNIPLKSRVETPTLVAEENREKVISLYLKFCAELNLFFFEEEKSSLKAFGLLAALSKKCSSRRFSRWLDEMNPSNNFDNMTMFSPKVIGSFLNLLNSLRKKHPEKILTWLTAFDSKFSYLLAIHQPKEVLERFITLMEELLRQGLSKENRVKFIDSIRFFGFAIMETPEHDIKHRFIELLESLAKSKKSDVLNLLKQPFGSYYPNICTAVAMQTEASVKESFLRLLRDLCLPSRPTELTAFLLPYIVFISDHRIENLSPNQNSMFKELVKQKDVKSLFFLFSQGFLDGSFYSNQGQVYIEKSASIGMTPKIFSQQPKDSGTPLTTGYQWLEQNVSASELWKVRNAIYSYLLSVTSPDQRKKYLGCPGIQKFFSICDKVLEKTPDPLLDEIFVEEIRLNTTGIPKSNYFDGESKRIKEFPVEEDLETSTTLVVSHPDSKMAPLSDLEKLEKLFLNLFEAASTGDKDFYKRFFDRLYEYSEFDNNAMNKLLFGFICQGCIPKEAYKHLSQTSVNLLLRKADDLKYESIPLKSFIQWVGDDEIESSGSLNLDSKPLQPIPARSDKCVISTHQMIEMLRVLVDPRGDFSSITKQDPIIVHRFLDLLNKMAEKDRVGVLDFLHEIRNKDSVFSYELANNCPDETVNLFLKLIDKLRIMSEKDKNYGYIRIIAHMLEYSGFPIMLKHSEAVKKQFLDLITALISTEIDLNEENSLIAVEKKRSAPGKMEKQSSSKKPKASNLVAAIHQLMLKPYPEKNNLNLAWAVAWQDDMSIKEQFFGLLKAIRKYNLETMPFILPHLLLKFNNVSDKPVETDFKKKTVFNALADRNDGKTLVALLKDGLLNESYCVDDQGFFVASRITPSTSSPYISSSPDLQFLTWMVKFRLADELSRERINGYEWLDKYDKNTLKKAKKAMCEYLLGLKTSQNKLDLLKDACDSDKDLGKLFILQTGFLKTSKERGSLKELNDELLKLRKNFQPLPKPEKSSFFSTQSLSSAPPSTPSSDSTSSKKPGSK